MKQPSKEKAAWSWSRRWCETERVASFLCGSHSSRHPEHVGVAGGSELLQHGLVQLDTKATVVQ